MRARRIWLSLSVGFFLLILAGIGDFLWKNNQPVPGIDQVESHFESEIETLNDLTSSINVEELYYRPHEALPKSRADKARQHFSESGILSASVIFHHPGSNGGHMALFNSDSPRPDVKWITSQKNHGRQNLC